MKETLGTFQFETASGLRDWLNGFKKTDIDLSTVYIGENPGLDYLTLAFEEETLTDGSRVNNMVVGCGTWYLDRKFRPEKT